MSQWMVLQVECAESHEISTGDYEDRPINLVAFQKFEYGLLLSYLFGLHNYAALFRNEIDTRATAVEN